MEHVFSNTVNKYLKLLSEKKVSFSDVASIAMRLSIDCNDQTITTNNQQLSCYKKGGYVDYYERIGMNFDYTLPDTWSEKQKTFLQILSMLNGKAKTACDLGSNNGWYSFLLEHKNYEVVAVDSDDAVVSHMYERAKAENRALVPLRCDILQFTSFGLSFDLVIILAVIHHLVLIGENTLEVIFENLSKITKKFLLAEFVSLNDERVINGLASSNFFVSEEKRLSVFSYIEKYAAEFYTWDNFITQGNKHFKNYHIFPSENEHRKIVLFIK